MALALFVLKWWFIISVCALTFIGFWAVFGLLMFFIVGMVGALDSIDGYDYGWSDKSFEIFAIVCGPIAWFISQQIKNWDPKK